MSKSLPVTRFPTTYAAAALTPLTRCALLPLRPLCPTDFRVQLALKSSGEAEQEPSSFTVACVSSCYLW